MQKTMIIGRVGKDAIVSQLASTSVVNFSICHSEKWKDKDGVQHEKSQWFDCAYFSDRTAIAQYIKKGDELYVEGIVDCKVYANAKGETLPQLTLRVHQIQLIGNKPQATPQPAAAPAATPRTVNSDIPQSPESEQLPF